MTVVLDVDSTLSSIEGIDWLAGQCGESIAAEVADLTDKAMRGDIALEEVYGRRLSIVRPDRTAIDALGREYVATTARGAVAAIAEWKSRGVTVILVSGGIRNSILPLAGHVGLESGAVHAVDVHFQPDGEWAGFDSASPLTRSAGKREIVAQLDLPRPLIAVGDGSTDAAVRATADAFAAFTGFVTRPTVADDADFVVTSFDDLTPIILGDG